MKRLILMIMGLMLFSSCSLLKKSTKEKAEFKDVILVEVEKEVFIEDKSTTQIISIIDEKSEIETFIEVSGNVRIEPDGSISGDNAKFSSSKKKSTKLLESSKNNNDIKVMSVVDSTFKQKTEANIKKTESAPSNKTYWFAIGGVILFALVIWGLNKLK